MKEPEYGLVMSGDIEKIYPKGEDYTKNGHCSRCGSCCTHHLHILPSEEARIKAYIKKHNIKPVLHDKDIPDNEALVDLVCPFFNDKGMVNSCSIYEVRPAICKCYQCNFEHEDLDKRYESLIASGELNPIEFLLNAHESNVGQLFYPEEFTPKAGELVIINQLHMLEFNKHINDIFVRTQKQRKHDCKTEVLLQNPKNGETFWFDIQGLTRINLPKGK